MKKFISVIICLVIFLTLFSGCKKSENNVSRLLFDTAVTLTARCERSVLLEAFNLCKTYEDMFSRTKENSDVYKINSTKDFVEVSEETVFLIKTALTFCEETKGAFDITITPVINLWDFNNAKIPRESDIKNALKNVDYRKIKIDGNKVSSGGAQIDLGSIAKGYIADRLYEFFKEKGVNDAIINLGGNVYVMGEEYTKIGVKTPFKDGVSGVITAKDVSVVTSGTYQRSFEKDGKLYHHILDTKTGYPTFSDLDSVTVVGKSSTLCDALSTVCLISGSEQAVKTLKAKNLCGVLITKSGQIITVGDIDFEKS